MNNIHFREVKGKDGFTIRIDVYHNGSRRGNLKPVKGLILRDGSSQGGWSISIPGHYDHGLCLYNDIDGVKHIIARDWDKAGHLLKGDQSGAIIGTKTKGKQSGQAQGDQTTTNAKGGKQMLKLRFIKTPGVREVTMTADKVPVGKILWDEKKGWHAETALKNALAKSGCKLDAGYKLRGEQKGSITYEIQSAFKRGILDKWLEGVVAKAKPAGKVPAKKKAKK